MVMSWQQQQNIVKRSKEGIRNGPIRGRELITIMFCLPKISPKVSLQYFAVAAILVLSSETGNPNIPRDHTYNIPVDCCMYDLEVY
jgi:hypothetical protein